MTQTIRGRRTRLGGATVFARVAGPAAGSSFPPLVFVHGLMVAGGHLQPTLTRLADRYEVAAPDLPGFGASDKPSRTLAIEELSAALERWVESEVGRRVMLVGCSMGTQVAADLAARRPGLVVGVVLLGPVMDPAARSARTATARWVRELPHELEQLPLMIRDYARGGLRRARETFAMMLEFPIEDRLARLTIPTVVVRGGSDRIVSRAWAAEAAALPERGRFVELPGAAHAANFTSPAAFAAAIDAFAAHVGAPEATAGRRTEGVPM